MVTVLQGAAGNVGGYNTFWIDNGTDVVRINGEFRSSIVVLTLLMADIPPVTDEARNAIRAALGSGEAPRREGGANDGTAYWLDAGLDAPGPYDNPEQETLRRTLSDVIQFDCWTTYAAGTLQ